MTSIDINGCHYVGSIAAYPEGDISNYFLDATSNIFHLLRRELIKKDDGQIVVRIQAFTYEEGKAAPSQAFTLEKVTLVFYYD